jgi:hypothetical protein
VAQRDRRAVLKRHEPDDPKSRRSVEPKKPLYFGVGR